MLKILFFLLFILVNAFSSTYDLSDGEVLFPGVLDGKFKGSITNPIGAVESPLSWKPAYISFEGYSDDLKGKNSLINHFLQGITEDVKDSILQNVGNNITYVNKDYALPLFLDTDLKKYQSKNLEAIKNKLEQSIKKIRAYLFDFYIILYSPKNNSKIILCSYENERLLRAKKLFKTRGYDCYGLHDIAALGNLFFSQDINFDFVAHISSNGILQDCAIQFKQLTDGDISINDNADMTLLSGTISYRNLDQLKDIINSAQEKLSMIRHRPLIFDSYALIAKGKMNAKNGEKHLILFEEAENEKLSRMIEVLNSNGFNKNDIQDFLQTPLSPLQLDKIYDVIERNHAHKKLKNIWGK